MHDNRPKCLTARIDCLMPPDESRRSNQGAANTADSSRAEASEAALIQALDEIFGFAHRRDAPGLIVGVALKGRTLYRRGFGLASVQHGVANLPTTRVRIASISKHFTSLACLLLAEEGKLDIDAPASRYLPELPALATMPTLRQFMAHTSGYRCTLEMGALANGLTPQPPGWQLSAMARQTDLHFAPGAGQIYCNGTYHLLSLVIERVSGASYETFLKRRIFTPLGMHDTDSIADDTEMVPRLASPHIRSPEGRWQRPVSDSELRGDGGIVSTIDDMLRWMAHMNGGKVVGNEATWRQLLEPVTLTNGLRSVYTLGLRRHRYRGVEVIHHSGGLFGLNAQMLTVPEHRLDIIIFVNGAPVRATELAGKVLDAVLSSAHLVPPRKKAAAAGYPQLAGAFYRGVSGLFIGFEQVDGKLALSLFNLPAAPVLYEEGDSLQVGFEDVGMGPLVFEKSNLQAIDGGAPDSLPVTVAGTPETLQRLGNKPSATPLSAAYLSGRYVCAALAAEARFIEEDTGHTLRLRGDYSAERRLTLTPHSSTDFAAIEPGGGGARFVISIDSVKGQLQGFWVDSYRARRLRFDRVRD
jgi:D-aminopeptidase